MALLFVDGFDHYDPKTYPSLKWDSGADTSWMSWDSSGRRGGKAIKFGSPSGDSIFYKTLAGNYATLILGAAINFRQSIDRIATGFLQLYDGATCQIYISKNASGYLEVYRGDGTLLGTHSVTLVTGTWYYIELKVTFHNSAGALQFRINEYLAIDLSGIDTQNSANAYANKIKMCSPRYMPGYVLVETSFDDLYICDDSGAQNNDFLGDCRIDVILPDGDSGVQEWTPSAGNNYECVDDSAFDNGTNYVSTATVDNQDLYTFANAPVGLAGIKAIQINSCSRRTDSGVPTKMKPVLNVGGSDYLQAEITLTDQYLDHRTIVELNPDTSLPWAVSDLNSLICGVNLSSNPLE